LISIFLPDFTRLIPNYHRLFPQADRLIDEKATRDAFQETNCLASKLLAISD